MEWGVIDAGKLWMERKRPPYTFVSKNISKHNLMDPSPFDFFSNPNNLLENLQVLDF
jgi:hypothetical protein